MSQHIVAQGTPAAASQACFAIIVLQCISHSNLKEIQIHVSGEGRLFTLPAQGWAIARPGRQSEQ